MSQRLLAHRKTPFSLIHSQRPRVLLGQDFFVKSTDGTRLVATLFKSKKTSERNELVIVSPATGVKRGYYANFSHFLATQYDVPVLTYDYRGVGGSAPEEGLKGYQASILDWGTKDFEGMLRYAKSEFGDKDIFVVGHSIGAHIVGLAPSALSSVKKIAAISAHNPYYHNSEFGRNKLLVGAAWFVIFPLCVKLFGYFPGKALGFSEDLPGPAALQWRDWSLQRDFLFHDPERKKPYSALKVPLLGLSFTDDEFGSEAQFDEFYKHFDNATLTKVHVNPSAVGFPSIGHLGVFRYQYKDPFWTWIGDWLFHHKPPPYPSQ